MRCWWLCDYVRPDCATHETKRSATLSYAPKDALAVFGRPRRLCDVEGWRGWRSLEMHRMKRHADPLFGICSPIERSDSIIFAVPVSTTATSRSCGELTRWPQFYPSNRTAVIGVLSSDGRILPSSSSKLCCVYAGRRRICVILELCRQPAPYN